MKPSIWADEPRALIVAIQFLTRLPMPTVAFRPELLAKSALYFPLVGLIVGALGSVCYVLAIQWWTPAIATSLAMIAMILVTGAFHEDGLADCADGLGGAWSREDKLRIMKDSRIGSYGGLALVCSLLLKFALLSSLAPAAVPAALILSQMLGRWSTLPLIALVPYVGGGSGKPFVDGISLPRMALASAYVIGCLALGAPGRWAALLFVSLIAASLSGLLFRRQIGGITGDTLGAANQVVELCALLVLTAVV